MEKEDNGQAKNAKGNAHLDSISTKLPNYANARSRPIGMDSDALPAQVVDPSTTSPKHVNAPKG